MDENKKNKETIDEEKIDEIVREAQSQKTLKEQIYDRIKLPIWVLDVIIVVSIIALVAILLSGKRIH